MGRTIHTPGPWINDEGIIYAEAFVGDASQVIICEASPINAPLIAEAPCLLESLEDIIQMLPRPYQPSEKVQKALAAIKRAKGAA